MTIVAATIVIPAKAGIQKHLSELLRQPAVILAQAGIQKSLTPSPRQPAVIPAQAGIQIPSQLPRFLPTRE